MQAVVLCMEKKCCPMVVSLDENGDRLALYEHIEDEQGNVIDISIGEF